MSSLAPHWQVFSAPWRQRKTEKSYGSLVAVAALLAAIWVFVAFTSGFSPSPTLFSSAILLSFGLEILWILQVVACMKYNRPWCVLTVPRYLTVQRQTVLATWCAVVGLQTAVCMLCRELGAYRITPSNLLLVLMLGLLSLLFPILLRWTTAAGAVAISSLVWKEPLSTWLAFHLPPAQRWALWADYGAWITLAALPTMAWIVVHVVRPGNDAHRAAYHRLFSDFTHSRLLQHRGSAPSVKPSGGWTGWQYRHIFNWRFKRMLSIGDERASAALARAELAFGPGLLWWNQLATAVLVVCVFGVCVGVLQWLWGREGEFIGKQVVANPIASIAVALLAWSPFIMLPFLLVHTRKEQALMSLLPGLPTGAALARSMAVRLVRRAAITWVCMVLVLWSLPVRQYAWIALSLVTLQSIPFLVRDWSRLSAAHAPSFAMVGALVGIVVAVALEILLLKAVIPLALCVGVALVCCAANLAWRWGKLDDYTQPLPIGRAVQSRG